VHAGCVYDKALVLREMKRDGRRLCHLLLLSWRWQKSGMFYEETCVRKKIWNSEIHICNKNQMIEGFYH
jgi:hypothetical protein